eukprot:scaffold7477_cov649-Pinguiococcus_pyrenoidosus.AAC.1
MNEHPLSGMTQGTGCRASSSLGLNLLNMSGAAALMTGHEAINELRNAAGCTRSRDRIPSPPFDIGRRAIFLA